jgi:hypothetical protein
MDKLNGAGCACIGMNCFAKADDGIVKAWQSRRKLLHLIGILHFHPVPIKARNAPLLLPM